MARPLRIEYPGAFYHVLNRGHRREPIVQDSQDRERFVSDMSRMAGQYRVLVHSYCLMANHYHLILETPDGNLSRAMQWLNVAYAAYYNRRHNYCGHVFQGRFQAILVDAGAYLQALSRYIHLNPVRAGVTRRASAYRWSSCRYFIGPDKAPDWLEIHRILSGFARTEGVARRRYTDYLSEPAANPLEGVVAGSVLGPPTFTEWVKRTFLSQYAADPEFPDLKDLQPHPSVDAIVHAVAEYYDVRDETIIARGRKRNRPRDVAIYLSRECSGLQGRDLGRHFGGISGAGVTMRCNDVRRRTTDDRQLAEDLRHVRHRILNNE